MKLEMARLCGLLVTFLICLPQLSSSLYRNLSSGSSLSVEDPTHILISPNGILSSGFYKVGDNAYAFAVWFSEPSCIHDCSLIPNPDCTENCTLVWMANTEHPVNAKSSKLELLRTGNLVLKDAAKLTVWSTGTVSSSAVYLKLIDTGNLVLESSGLGAGLLWQSFDFPTDTLLPNQLFKRDMELVSSRSRGNFSSGLYKLFFGDDNILHLRYERDGISSIFWPHPWILAWQSGRSTYNNTRVAVLDSLGSFTSSDNLNIQASDYGVSSQRRLKLDSDGNLRLYSRGENGGSWAVSWQASSHPCRIHGVCGENSICRYDAASGKSCSCLPAYKMKNVSDWTFGCEPEFKFLGNDTEEKVGFLQLHLVDFYGYDIGNFINHTLEECKHLCLLYNCSGFEYTFDYASGVYICYPKNALWNGYSSSSQGDFYMKLPIQNLTEHKMSPYFGLKCLVVAVLLERDYEKIRENGAIKLILWLVIALGAFQLMFFLAVYYCLLIGSVQQRRDMAAQNRLSTETGFRRFTYSELKEATNNFSEEIGRGGTGIVYKGRLPDLRVAAVKRLNHASQVEEEFLAEVSTFGKLNHMNLIEMWGYCAERNHRLLAYEYLEYGSLAETLLSQQGLDWRKRYKIALGTARGLAYLHEECLEQILHCDVKPQNILLDSQYCPKVSDFGLSKLLDRCESNNNSGFSRIRGTRGYMAPEWISNLPITSKVDVFSYGVVILELVTGTAPSRGVRPVALRGKVDSRGLISWVRNENDSGPESSGATDELLVEGTIDPRLDGDYNIVEAQTLLGVGLLCVQEDKDARPTMSQVVELLSRSNLMGKCEVIEVI